MRTLKKQTTYETEDGSEFESKEAAERHETLCQVRQAYDDAKLAYGMLLAERCKTADGEPFQLGMWHDYYYITPGYFSWPKLLKVDFWGRNWTWEQRDEDDQLVIISDKNDVGGKMDQTREFRIEELFADKGKAEAALKVRRECWLDEKRRELKG